MGKGMPSKYELAADETVPVARSIIARELVQKYQLRETDVAEYLGVAQAAVSKYMNGKHSEKLKKRMGEIDARIKGERELIDGYIAKIAEGRKEYVNVCVCTICTKANSFVCAFSHARVKEVTARTAER